MRVRFLKISGGYIGSTWIYLGMVTTLDSKIRYICESEQIKGLLHIFSPEQLKEIE